MQNQTEISETEIKSIQDKFKNLTIVDRNTTLIPLSKIRNKNTKIQDFRINADRIMRILIEVSLAINDHQIVERSSPLCNYSSHEINEDNYVCITIMRAGNAFLHEIFNVMPSVKVGMILIQRDENSDDKKPVLFYKKLPQNLNDKKILLCDPMLATGGTVRLAITELLKVGVKEENITFINLICWKGGLDIVFNKYPKIKIVTSTLDPELNGDKYICPGLGDFGCRYFGTVLE